jgi:hypothetical protein
MHSSPDANKESAVTELPPHPTRPHDAAKLLEAGVYVVGIFIAASGIFEARTFPDALPMGPGLVPILACGVMGIFSLVGLIALLRRSPSAGLGKSLGGRQTLLLVAAMLGYVLLLQVVSFLAATLILSIAWYVLSLDRPSVATYSSRWASWLGIVVFVLLTYLVFNRLLNVSFY